MARVKLTIAAIALVLTAGTTMAFQKSNASTQATEPDCSSQPNSSVVDVTSSVECLGSEEICCYFPGTENVYARKHP